MAAEDFRKLNLGFMCEACGLVVLPAPKTSRNHCPYCLVSKHVDIIPGDRKEVCQGLMDVIDYEYKQGKYILRFKCRKCGKEGVNKAAADDDLDQILTI